MTTDQDSPDTQPATVADLMTRTRQLPVAIVLVVDDDEAVPNQTVDEILAAMSPEQRADLDRRLRVIGETLSPLAPAVAPDSPERAA